MSPGRVTLGVPVYNGEVYLPEALDSLLAQDFQDLEVVVSDNASTDATPDICADYARRDGRVRWVRNETNRGAAYNYNRLVDLADTEYFKWASADDVCAPSLVRRCVEVLDAQPEVVLAYPRTLLIDAAGDVIREHPDRLHMPYEHPWDRMRHFAQYRWLCNPCFGVMRTRTLRGTHLVRPGISSDVSLLGELALAGQFHEVDEALFLRRVVPTSCGLGELSDDEVAAWFDPTRTGTRFPVQLRVYLEIASAILGGDLPAPARARTAGVFTYTWAKRRVAIRRWHLRQHRARRRASRSVPA